MPEHLPGRVEHGSLRTAAAWFVTLNPLESHPRLHYAGIDTAGPGMGYHWDARVHRRFRDTTVFQYTISGEGRFRYRRKLHALPPGAAFLCNTTDPDYAYFYPPEASEPWAFLFVNLDGGMALAAEMVARHGPVYTIGTDSGFVTAVREYVSSEQPTHYVSMERTVSLVGTLLTELLSCAASPVAARPASRVVRRACELVERRVAEPLDVATVARAVGVTREHLARAFRRHLHAGPAEFINTVKVRRACILLTRTELPVVDVAARVGYGNPSHFARVFRRIVRQSPTTYRALGIAGAV
jgi:AraC-like DNA-binding protein